MTLVNISIDISSRYNSFKPLAAEGLQYMVVLLCVCVIPYHEFVRNSLLECLFQLLVLGHYFMCTQHNNCDIHM